MKFITYLKDNSTSQKTHITNYKDKPPNAVRGNNRRSFLEIYETEMYRVGGLV